MQTSRWREQQLQGEAVRPPLRGAAPDRGRARGDAAPARDAGDAAARGRRSCRVCRARSSRSPTPLSAARGRGCGAARRARAPAIAIPTASIRTSTGVPWRPSTKVWWNSSRGRVARARSQRRARAQRRRADPEAAQGSPPAERQHRVLGHVCRACAAARPTMPRSTCSLGWAERKKISRHHQQRRHQQRGEARGGKSGVGLMIGWSTLTLALASARDGDSLITITRSPGTRSGHWPSSPAWARCPAASRCRSPSLPAAARSRSSSWSSCSRRCAAPGCCRASAA